MTNRELEVRLTLADNFSKVLDSAKTATLKFSADLKKIASDMARVGREISQVGRTMAMIGGAITAPLALAYRTTGEYSATASRQIWAMQMAFRDMSVTVGQALLPIIERFKNGIEKLRDAFLSMNPQLREHLIQAVAMTGVWLTVGGVFLATVGKMLITLSSLLKLGAQFLTWCAKSTVAMFGMTVPAWAIILVIGAIIAAMIKWKGVADFVMNGMEIGWNVLLVVVKSFYIGLQTIFDGIIRGFAFVVGALEKIPSPWKKNLHECRVFLDIWRSGIEKDMNKTADGIKVNSLKIGDILSGKNGSFANGFDNFKKGIFDIGAAWQELMKNLNSGGDKSGSKKTNFFTGFMLGLEQARQALADWADYGRQIAQRLSDSMTTTFSNFFYDGFTNQLKSAQEYFAEFGNFILRMFSDIIARMITEWATAQAIMGIGKMFGGSVSGGADLSSSYTSAITSFHTGGVVKKAHSGMLASDEVPIIAQLGEGVISRKGMSALGKGNFDRLNRGDSVAGGSQGVQISPVIVIQAFDTADVMKHRKIIGNMIEESLRKNSSLRNAILQYT